MYKWLHKLYIDIVVSLAKVGSFMDLTAKVGFRLIGVYPQKMGYEYSQGWYFMGYANKNLRYWRDLSNNRSEDQGFRDRTNKRILGCTRNQEYIQYCGDKVVFCGDYS